MVEAPFPSAELLEAYLDNPEAARLWLSGLGLRDPERGLRDLRDIARRVDNMALVADLAGQLNLCLPRSSEPGMALTNLERFLTECPDPSGTVELLRANPRTTEIMIQVFSTSQYFSEMLIRDTSLLTWLRAGTDRLDRDALISDLATLLDVESDDEAIRLAIRQYRRRETLRIGYNDIVRGLPLEVTTVDLSHLADACVEAAYRYARRRAELKYGQPTRADGQPAQFVVLALGKLGGTELNYSSDIDLIFLYDEDGPTEGGPRPTSNAEFFTRLGGEIVRLLSDHSALGIAYRVDMRLRPDGDQGSLARSLSATVNYYETSGRTWERQALIKCRPIAGDLNLGAHFLEAIRPFVYRRYLGAAEIAEIKAMKRRIESRTLSAGTDDIEVKTGRGGIRDVEFVVQFLQLLHGGQYPVVRHANTLAAIVRLEDVGCLSAEERGIMEDTYRFLRRLEHRLQIMFDRQTHQMPQSGHEQRTLAIRMGYPPASLWEDSAGPSQRFLTDYRYKTEMNRQILNHLLHDTFKDDNGVDVDPVVDLVLDPEPSDKQIEAALGRYPFRDRVLAYENLMALAREDTPFLSHARCRHFLAAIAPRLLQAVGSAADPDMALTNLEKVSASLGAKAILWELFNFNPPTLRLYVELCASSQFLSEILINNPGMVDDLMDSLVVDRPQSAKMIRGELAELCKGAEDISPILFSFRNTEWVRIGVRDILRREPIRDVTRELADVAEAIVAQVAHSAWQRRSIRYGTPRKPDGRPSRWAVLGLGKFGGRELNYHSDLDLIVIYEEDGETQGGERSIPNEQFVAEVAKASLRALGGDGAGPLYQADIRLRPHGISGPLVVSLARFREYFAGAAQAWERMALTRARPIHSTGDFGKLVAATIEAILVAPINRLRLATEVVAMRKRLEVSAPPGDLKRGIGGLADIEFVVQYLQLIHAADQPNILHPNTWDALTSLRRARLITSRDHSELRASYDFLREVEGRLRIVQNRSVSDWPVRPDELVRLARRLGYDASDQLEAVAALIKEAGGHRTHARNLFHKILGVTESESAGITD